MVAIVAGTGLGLERSSGWILGARGQVGQASLGRANENVYVNAATGNLVITNTDEVLIGRGPDAAIARTYNSLGNFDGDNNDGWRMSVYRQLVLPVTGTLESAGSTIRRIDWDGSDTLYTWNATENAYIGEEGAGSYDSLKRDSSTGLWTWTDGDSRIRETYDGGNGRLLTTSDMGLLSEAEEDAVSSTYEDDNIVTYAYDSSGHITRVTTQNNATGAYSYVDLKYTGNLLDQLDTYAGAVNTAPTLTRVRYGYDSESRLTSVTVDLTPQDTSDSKVFVTTYTYVDLTKRIASISQSDQSRLDIDYIEVTTGNFRVWKLKQTVSAGVVRQTIFDYNPTTKVTTVTDPAGQITSFTYLASGQLSKITYPFASAEETVQQTTTITYAPADSTGDVTKIVRGINGTGTKETIDYTYDPHGNLIRQRNASTGETIDRTYGNNNELLTETRYVDDPDGSSPLLGTPLTTRFSYDSTKHLRFSVTAEGRVIEYRYNAYGQQITTVEYAFKPSDATPLIYDVSGLGATDTITVATLASWVAGITDKSGTKRTDTAYDFRGNIQKTTTYEKMQSSGAFLTSSQRSEVNYVYDQRGNLLSRLVTGLTGQEVYTYDGLGRILTATDFNAATTSYAFHDALSQTVVTLADGMNQVSTFNRAGESIDYVESDTGANQVALANWPSGTPPTGYATIDGWQNPAAYVDETEWAMTNGPDGMPVVAMRAGQQDPAVNGGGNYTNYVTIEGNKAYQFIFYFKKSDLTRQSVYFGLNANSGTPYVENASTGADSTNGLFLSMTAATQQTKLQADHWYKVVGYVLAEGSSNVTAGTLGGVYDNETGVKVENTTILRWKTTRPDSGIAARMYN